MDLLDLLLRDPHEDARQRLRDALASNAHRLQEVTFNVFEVTLDRDANEARVFDVLDGTADPTVLSLDELRRRSDGGIGRVGFGVEGRLRHGPSLGLADRRQGRRRFRRHA